MALLAGAFQIFVLVDAGILNKFGKSPLSFTSTGIMLNLILVATTLLGTEFSRGYLARSLNRKSPTLTLTALTLLYTFTNVSVLALTRLDDPLNYTKFMGESFLPTLTGNLLATYLAMLSGPIASLAYRAPLQAFQWFSPILPDLPWSYQSLIGVMAPTISYVTINMTVTQRDLRKAGMATRRKPKLRLRKSENSITGWMVVSVVMVLVVWSSTGLLGFYPTIIASGSMRPTLDVGDIALVLPVEPSAIRVGDIIQYWQQEEMILHRVYEISKTEGQTVFVMKGDANTGPDLEPIFPNQIRGKLAFMIPSLGWASIHVKTAFATVWAFLSSNIAATYGMLGILLAGMTIYASRKRTNRNWRRKR